MSTRVAVTRGLSRVTLFLSALPMVLITLGMLAIAGQQCTPTSVTHSLEDRLGTIAFAFVGYAIPAAPAVLFRQLGNANGANAILSLVCAAGAVVYAVLALGLLAMGTTC